ncbi:MULTISPECIES: GntR family transcriptional regulator [unclassified Microbacterium]|uniref:GntR family transcriptional regulator n=1 Tax=unclassified Microbacterium TaxID=2609290 RepID=UPI002468BC9D|nr:MULTISPECIES: GntR family transcriptional regulator [unclassified Microbacterium]MDH5132424.1 GntR family transcriptional regulator [Microbacterium sp. RD10]MDH5137046.1 GntR family transcriptional regulator [Microbacterium sp. RD11]MDH5146581.1 GntR family transcriptional regulator [Microbacterium sp. RD12]MDH5154352.1 GntR family transcriptional regulator [Microbacterium sp. RD06]MDH5167849.1 GntR family transcriptional regulator [Microbacterium sp. RD02]
MSLIEDAIDRHSAAPMYDQLRQLIIDGIARDGLQPGDPLPGEHRLCERYGISRTVVRQALAQLEHEGLVERVKGKGTFVSRPRTSESLVHTLVGLYDDVERRGGHVHSDVLRHEQTVADEEVALALEVPVGSPVIVLERLRHVDGEPWSLSTTWMPEAVGAVTLGADLTEASLYRLLADHGIIATHGVRSAEATVATHEQAQHLGVSAGSALLRLRSISRSEDGVPIEYFIAYHRGDRSRFEFQLQREQSQASLMHVDGSGGASPAGTVG